jgi:hypothetical protein
MKYGKLYEVTEGAGLSAGRRGILMRPVPSIRHQMKASAPTFYDPARMEILMAVTGELFCMFPQYLKRVPANYWLIQTEVDEQGFLFWSNQDGWTHLGDADVYTDIDRYIGGLPMDGEWVRLPAKKPTWTLNYLGKPFVKCDSRAEAVRLLEHVRGVYEMHGELARFEQDYSIGQED